jgi:hypothetical protein
MSFRAPVVTLSTMEFGHDRARTVPLAPVAGDLVDFRIDGFLEGAPVRALWDGRAVRMTESLYRRAELAVAIDDVFVEAGLGPTRWRSTLSGPPSRVVLTLARTCDVVEAAEYTLRGHHRAIRP